MFKSPYNTTVGKNLLVGSIVNEVTERLMSGVLYQVDDRNIHLVTNEHPSIKAFAHPMIINEGGKNVIVADVRHASRYDRNSGKLKGGDELDYVLLRCKLMEEAWVNDNSRDLLNAGDFQIKVFSMLISENIGQRMHLDLATQAKLRVITAYYYLCLFFDEMPNDEDDRLKYIKRISRCTGIQVQNIIDILEGIDPIYNSLAFIDVVKENLDSVRFNNFNTGILYTLLGGIWYGSNANEHMGIALEHPPTFVAMLYQVTTNRNYRKSILGTIVNRIAKEEIAKQFVMNVKRLVE